MYCKKIVKCILLCCINCLFFYGLIGCALTNIEEDLPKKRSFEYENADELYEIITYSLETEDANAIKELFSPYALEKTIDLDEKIQELIEFYPGCNGGYDVVVPTHRTSNYGEIEYLIYPKYKITNDDKKYQMRLTVYVENDLDRDKEGLYMVQIMTDDAWTDGFEWKDEEDNPGIYILE